MIETRVDVSQKRKHIARRDVCRIGVSSKTVKPSAVTIMVLNIMLRSPLSSVMFRLRKRIPFFPVASEAKRIDGFAT